MSSAIEHSTVSIPVLLLDGGLGTALEDPPYSMTFDRNTPIWSSHPLISSPSTLTSVHSSFIEAGADIVLSATYQASFEGFRLMPRPESGSKPRKGQDYVASGGAGTCNATGNLVRDSDFGYSDEEAKSYMRSAVTLAQDAFRGLSTSQSRTPRVALSLGPYGATLVPAQEYSGKYPPDMDSSEELQRWHVNRLGVYDEQVWSNVTVEWVAFETMVRPDEVRAVRRAMHQIQYGRDVTRKWWVTGVFPGELDEGGEWKQNVRAWVRAAMDVDEDTATKPPWGLGVNCTAVEKLGSIVRVMAEEIERLEAMGQWRNAWGGSSGRPWLVIYPDGASGLTYDTSTMIWVETGSPNAKRNWDACVWTTVQDERHSMAWGGIIVGGCCKTTVEDIAKLRKRIDEH